ncbi:hypothetical protein [Chryseobacterium sp. EO14]|uniref:hypothetical protein n=1 Tax=Chryseobacterium sp. EO14 TaxID=2950551 RepID=UPI00210A0C07|nr:hypothetical protein [Chryseobacterium sp. EO14]MCQ4139222.1 hypothetical protein [Chryseobacterium sp. EO14]
MSNTQITRSVTLPVNIDKCFEVFERLLVKGNSYNYVTINKFAKTVSFTKQGKEFMNFGQVTITLIPKDNETTFDMSVVPVKGSERFNGQPQMEILNIFLSDFEKVFSGQNLLSANKGCLIFFPIAFSIMAYQFIKNL